jgi:argininosuccinate lyase
LYETTIMASATVKKTLWAKDLPLDQAIHQFTVGRDPEIDLKLYPFDCIASAAHARMLGKVGLLPGADVAPIVAQIQKLYALSVAGQVRIEIEQEDCHTAIEAALTEALGEAGKRIHLARSRNDQVLVALRLFMRQSAIDLAWRQSQLARALISFARRYAVDALPGYTHMRKAMPSTFGLWALGYAEALVEDIEALGAVYQRLDRCPLGAAAGFGVPLPIDRAYSAALLGFAKVQRSPTDCMNSRGRHEQALLDWCLGVAGTHEKLLWDLSLYTSEEFAFIRLPEAFTTGSSIMPNKRNPDVIELARAKCRELRGLVDSHRGICTGLPGSYHRDFQLAKAPLIDALSLTDTLTQVLTRLVPNLQPQLKNASAACTDELYAVHAAYALVASGESFREAYRMVAAQLINGTFSVNRGSLTAAHIGAVGDMQIEQLESELAGLEQWLTQKSRHHTQISEDIWSVAS